jgi:hypothetical protein
MIRVVPERAKAVRYVNAAAQVKKNTPQRFCFWRLKDIRKSNRCDGRAAVIGLMKLSVAIDQQHAFVIGRFKDADYGPEAAWPTESYDAPPRASDLTVK